MSNDPFLSTPILRNEDVFESSFQAETNHELNRIMESAFDTDWSPHSDSNNLSPRNLVSSNLNSPHMSSSSVKQISPEKKISPIKLISTNKRATSTPVKNLKSSHSFLGNKWRDSFQYADQQDYLSSSLGDRLSMSSDFFDPTALIQTIGDKIEHTTHNTTASTDIFRRTSTASNSSASTGVNSPKSGKICAIPTLSQNSADDNSILPIDVSSNPTNTPDKLIFASNACIDYNTNGFIDSRKVASSRSSTSTSLNSSPRQSFSVGAKNVNSSVGLSTRFSSMDQDLSVSRLRSRQNSSSLSVGSNSNFNINSRRYSVVSNGSKKVVIKKRSPSVIQRTTNRRLSMNSASYRKVIMDNEGNRNSVLRSLPHRPSLSTIYNSPEVSRFSNSVININSNPSINDYNNSPVLDRNLSSSSITGFERPLQRTFSESSSLIGYRYSSRSFSATIADCSTKFFDTFSLAYDDEGADSIAIDDAEYHIESSVDRHRESETRDEVLIYDDSMSTEKYAMFYEKDHAFFEETTYKIDEIKENLSRNEISGIESHNIANENGNSILSKQSFRDDSHYNVPYIGENQEGFDSNYQKTISPTSTKASNIKIHQATDKIKSSSSCTDLSIQDQLRSSFSSSNLLSSAYTNISSDNSIQKKDKKVYAEVSSNSSTSMFGIPYQNSSHSVRSDSSTSSSINYQDNNKSIATSGNFNVPLATINRTQVLNKEDEKFKNKPRKSNFVKSLFNNSKNRKYGHKSNRSISGKLGGSVSQMVSSFSSKDFFGVNKENDNDINDDDVDFSIINNMPNSKNNTNTMKSPKHEHQNSTEILPFGDKSQSANSALKSGEPLFSSREHLKDNITYKKLTQQEICLFNATPISKICKKNNIDYVELFKLMTICESTNNLIFQFEDFINLRISEEEDLTFKKITDSGCIEYFSEATGKLGSTKSFLKIVPFSATPKYHVMNPSLLICESIENLYNEITIYKLLRHCQGFPNLISSQMVRGKFPETLLLSWDNSISLNSSKFKPNFYQKEQLYLIQTFNVSGTSLRDFKLKSWKQANKIFWNLVIVLKSAEVNNKFEHRDLNWENVLVNDGGEDQSGPEQSNFIPFLQVTLTGFKYSRLEDENGTVICSDLSPTLKNFEETGDSLRYEIYKKMITNFFGDKDWSKHVKKTNLFWLYYVAYKLFYCKGLTKPDPCKNISSAMLLSPIYDDVLVSSDKFDSNDIYNAKEFESYNALKYVLKSLNPFTKTMSKLRQTPGYDCADPFGAIYNDNNLVLEYRKSRLREDVNLDNFNNMEDVLKWGEINRMTTWVIGE